MSKKNKKESYICQTTLQPTPNNTVVIENMTDIKESESCNDADATLKCDNKVKNLQTKLENVASTTITNQKRASLKKILSDTLYEKVKTRTGGIHDSRWAIADTCEAHNQSYPNYITRWTDHHVHPHVQLKHHNGYQLL